MPLIQENKNKIKSIIDGNKIMSLQQTKHSLENYINEMVPRKTLQKLDKKMGSEIKLNLDISETVIATCVVSDRRILRSYSIGQLFKENASVRSAVFNLYRIARILLYFLSVLGQTHFRVFCRLHTQTYMYANFQVSSLSGCTFEFSYVSECGK